MRATRTNHLVAVDASTLRRHARVSETLRASELQTIVQLRTPDGRPLTWSHLEVLATVRNPAARRAETAAAAAHGLSVRALRARLRGRCGRQDGAPVGFGCAKPHEGASGEARKD